MVPLVSLQLSHLRLDFSPVEERVASLHHQVVGESPNFVTVYGPSGSRMYQAFLPLPSLVDTLLGISSFSWGTLIPKKL